MRSVIDHTEKRTLTWKFGIVGITALCFVMLFYAISLLYAEPNRPSKPMHYDLYNCTRVEIQFEPSTLEYFIFFDKEKNLLSSAEREQLMSIKTIVSEDQEGINIFAAYLLHFGYYMGPVKGMIGIKNKMHVVGYRKAERVMSFTILDTWRSHRNRGWAPVQVRGRLSTSSNSHITDMAVRAAGKLCKESLGSWPLFERNEGDEGVPGPHGMVRCHYPARSSFGFKSEGLRKEQVRVSRRPYMPLCDEHEL